MPLAAFAPLNLLMLMMGTGEWDPRAADPFANLVFVLFLFMLPVLALNLLIAMMAATYERVSKKAHIEWVRHWASFLCARQRAVPGRVARFSLARARELMTDEEHADRLALSSNPLQSRRSSRSLGPLPEGYYVHCRPSELFEDQVPPPPAPGRPCVSASGRSGSTAVGGRSMPHGSSGALLDDPFRRWFVRAEERPKQPRDRRRLPSSHRQPPPNRRRFAPACD